MSEMKRTVRAAITGFVVWPNMVWAQGDREPRWGTSLS
jgi:hypothetical protein